MPPNAAIARSLLRRQPSKTPRFPDVLIRPIRANAQVDRVTGQTLKIYADVPSLSTLARNPRHRRLPRGLNRACQYASDVAVAVGAANMSESDSDFLPHFAGRSDRVVREQRTKDMFVDNQCLTTRRPYRGMPQLSG